MSPTASPLSGTTPGPAASSGPADAPAALGVDAGLGLDPDEAQRRLHAYGPNRLVAAPPRPGYLRFLDQFRSFLVLILIGAAVLAAAVGDLKDPIVIGIVVLANAFLGFFQERRAEKSLDALRSMLADTAKVRRGATVLEVPADELVPGDVVLLEAGDRVPADAALLVAHDLEVDESALTGESQPVAKSPEPATDPDAPLGDRTDRLFMQTVVTRGRAEAVVTETGMQTQVGALAALLRDAPKSKTPLQVQLHHLGHRLAAVAGVAVLAVVALGLAQGNAWDDLLLDAVALAVAAIPEGLPAVVTVTLAVGAHRMAKRNAIVKQLASVETLGSTTVICSDKTGTLTMNKMTATDEWTGRAVRPVLPDPAADPASERLARAMVLASDAQPDAAGSPAGPGAIGDPTEVALLGLAGSSAAVLAWRDAAPRAAEVPFDSATKFMATAHTLPGGDGTLVVMKGAMDAVLARCTTGPDGEPLDDTALEAIRHAHDALAGTGRRVLAAAVRTLPGPVGAGGLGDELHDLELTGLVGLVDPPRPEARDAIALCKRAGIRVKMITGDHAVTAAAIAADLGIEGGVLTGADLDRMTEAEVSERIDEIGVFARVAPEHKVLLVRVLRDRGEVVAMTGDGVNDAPALKHADIGVAMGQGGTEVTKEAASLVLTDDNFATIVAAVKDGRTIYDNIVKFVRFQLSTNIGAILSILGASLAGLAAPFTAIQILWVNLIMDGPPAIALGVDPPSPGTMDRAPRAPGAAILPRRRLSVLVWTGALMAAGTISVLALAPDPVAPTMAFTVFVLFQVFNAVNVRTEHGPSLGRHALVNPRLWIALGAVVVLQVLAVQWSVLQGIFDTTALDPAEWLVVVLVAAGLLLIEETRKRLVYRTRATDPKETVR
ncbi:MAG: cation-transporting P-type ATPase [Actinobacteria bacterium]|nr:cation-transporting P-type ATPase [Actinomycetota bacterium]